MQMEHAHHAAKIVQHVTNSFAHNVLVDITLVVTNVYLVVQQVAAHALIIIVQTAIMDTTLVLLNKLNLHPIMDVILALFLIAKFALLIETVVMFVFLDGLQIVMTELYAYKAVFTVAKMLKAI